MIQELKSERVLISLVICVLAAQIPHAQGVWYHASAQTLAFDWAHLWTWLCAWLFALGLELSTLMQVIRGRHLLSYVFALISVFINLFYFQIVTTSPLMQLPTRYWLLSIILPVAIAGYSHLCVSVVHSASPAQFWALGPRLRTLWQRLRWGQDDDDAAFDVQAMGARERAVLDAVRSGASSIYAIAKATEINASTLRRKNRKGIYTGLIEQLIQAGLLVDEDGVIAVGQQA